MVVASRIDNFGGIRLGHSTLFFRACCRSPPSWHKSMSSRMLVAIAFFCVDDIPIGHSNLRLLEFVDTSKVTPEPDIVDMEMR